MKTIPLPLFAPSIRYYYTDRQQNVWITNDRGVDKISFYPNKYKIRPIDNGLEIRAFLADKQKTSLGCFQKGKRQNLPSGWDIRRLPFSTGYNHPSRGYFRKKCVLFLWKINKEIYGWEPKKDGLILLKKKK